MGLGGFSRMAYLAVSITDLDVNAMEKKILGFMLTMATVPEGCGNLEICGHQLIILPFGL